MNTLCFHSLHLHAQNLTWGLGPNNLDSLVGPHYWAMWAHCKEEHQCIISEKRHASDNTDNTHMSFFIVSQKIAVNWVIELRNQKMLMTK